MKFKLREFKPQKKTQNIINIILELVEEFDIALTVRQVHYKLTEIPEAELPNTQSTYAKVSRILTDMRYSGLLDWEKISDGTRGTYKTTSYEDVDEAVQLLLDRYRRDRWKDNPYYVEVWTEKRTLINQFYQITDEFDVYLASGGGFSSATYIKDASKRLREQVEKGKKIIVYYFGDLDPSGDFMSEDIEKRFEEWGIPLEVKRVGLNEEHIEQYNLQKKFDVKVQKGNKIYNKIQADPRAKRMSDKFGEAFQIELEALDPKVLNKMLRESILEFANLEQQQEVIEIEKKEIKTVMEKIWRIEQ